ncbi:hypothetical protein H0A36_27115 [Endozoicomonas sp. SM1973]|uniref:Uncharacterized protein n=1 Tax=Spartinivicinus marinus TaxID=2994442 RepID=A0A853I6Z9_9GAMM|nr:hypothetical protein [Spartinivicinus marinus]NYZ69690.1 hypothetical protein [Spartinivicinus marinus]
MRVNSLFNFTIPSVLLVVGSSFTFLPNNADAARGGKGGKQTTAVATFTGTADCSTGVKSTDVAVGQNTSQCFTYDIEVEVKVGETAFDETTSDFNLSMSGEDCAHDVGADSMDECTDGSEDGSTDGVYVAQDGGDGGGSCVVSLSQPDSVANNNPPPQEPEFIIIQHDGAGNPAQAAKCTVTVWVETDLHRGQSDCSFGDPEVCSDDPNDILVYRPASCSTLKHTPQGDPVLDGNGNVVVDTFNMHQLKTFNKDGDPTDFQDLVQVLQAVDTDGDGLADCVDPFPNDPNLP